MDRFPRILTLAAVLLAAGVSARAQMDTGFGFGPDTPLAGPAAKPGGEPELTPMAVALSLAFDATTWFAVGVSTEAPAQEMAKLLLKGCYRSEILQLTLLAQRSGKKVPELVERRSKGDALRKIAGDLSLDYDRVYADAEVLARGVERSIETVSRIRVLTDEKQP